MGRPAKPVAFIKGHRLKAEIEGRLEAEKMLKGDDSNLVAPDYLTEDQKRYFDFFVEELRPAEILGNMDIPLLVNAARCFARLDMIEKKIDGNPELIFERETSLAQDRLVKQAARYMNELGISPASREKLAIKKAEKTQKTIGDMLKDDDE